MQQGGETKSSSGTPTSSASAGKFPSISLQFLSRLVSAFDYSNLAGIRAPMQGVSKSISSFRPMSLWSSKKSQGDQSIAGIEVWLSRCAVASEEIRGSAVVGLQKLALASGLLTSLLRLAETARRLENSVIPKENEKQTKHFMEYLFARVEDAARDCLFLPVSNKWVCEDCSNLNDPTADRCSLCLTTRSEQNTSAQVSTLRSKTGTSVNAPTRPTNIQTYRDMSNGILSILAQLARYRLGSSLNGVTTVYEPFLVEISSETFHMFLSLLRHVLLETEIKRTAAAAVGGDDDDYEFEQVVLDLVMIIKLNVRRQYAARVDGIHLDEVSTFLEGIEQRNVLPLGSTALSEIGAVRLELAKASGIIEIIKLMNANPTIMAVQASGCHALLEHVVMTKDQGKSVANAGGVTTVLAAVLYAHQTGHLEALLSGLRLLSKLDFSCYVFLFDGTDGDVLIDHILSIMKHNVVNVEIQLTAMRTLSLLAAGSNNTANDVPNAHSERKNSERKNPPHPAHKSERAKAIVSIVFEALLAHPKDKDIQKEGCFILGRLAADPTNIAIISKCGGIAAAQTIIKVSENDPSLQKMALTLLSKIMLSGGENLDLASQISQITPTEVLKCMRMDNDQNNNDLITPHHILVSDHTNGLRRDLHACCLRMLYTQMQDPLKRDEAIRQGVLDVTCNSMRKHCPFYGRVLNGTEFLMVLKIQKFGSTIVAEYMKTLTTDLINTFDLDKTQLVCSAYDKIGEKEEAIGQSMLHIYFNLLSKNPSEARLGAIATSLTAERVCNCMLRWPDNAVLQDEGIWCLEFLVSAGKREQIANAKGLRAICNAMKRCVFISFSKNFRRV